MMDLKTKPTSKAQLMSDRNAVQRDLIIPDVYDKPRREQLEQSDSDWLREYLPDVFYNPFTDDQLATIEDVGRVLKFGTLKCTAAERGDGKSSIVKYLMLKYALQRRLWFPLVIAATGPKAKKTTGSVRRRLASKAPTSVELERIAKVGNDTAGIVPNFLAEDYPLECLTARWVDPWPSRARNVTANGGRRISVEWGSADGYFIMPTFASECPLGPIFMSLGWSSDELQGCNIYDRRPDALMLDDLDSRSSIAAEQGVVASKIEETLETTIAGLGGPGRELGQYFLCTIPSELAAAARYSDPEQKPAWNGVRKRAIKKWPTNMKLWEEYIKLWQKGVNENDPHARISHQFYLDNREAMDKGSVISNPFRFSHTLLPDGSQKEASSLQRCMNYIAKHGRESFETEHQNNPPKITDLLESKITPYHVSNCAGDYDRNVVDPTVNMVCRGVDVRKIELHQVTLASEEVLKHRIADYAYTQHGGSETTVEQAEGKILKALYRMADQWEREPVTDWNGTRHGTDLTLIDKGWKGNWTEDGVVKTWATQPVETFCMKMGLRQWLPAKGDGRYRSPEERRRRVIVGDNWHINRGAGAERRCDEVIWNAQHWHMLAEELFMVSVDDPDRFELFIPADDYYTNHKAFGEHITAGAREMRENLSKATRSRKPRFVHDHWWDSLAMALVAQSIETFSRQRKASRKQMSLNEMAAAAK